MKGGKEGEYAIRASKIERSDVFKVSAAEVVTSAAVSCVVLSVAETEPSEELLSELPQAVTPAHKVMTASNALDVKMSEIVVEIEEFLQ